MKRERRYPFRVGLKAYGQAYRIGGVTYLVETKFNGGTDTTDVRRRFEKVIEKDASSLTGKGRDDRIDTKENVPTVGEEKND